MASNHHDTGYKELFSYPEFVQSLIEGFAPAELAERQTPLSGIFSIENAASGWEALQQAVDRIVALTRLSIDNHR